MIPPAKEIIRRLERRKRKAVICCLLDALSVDNTSAFVYPSLTSCLLQHMPEHLFASQTGEQDEDCVETNTRMTHEVRSISPILYGGCLLCLIRQSWKIERKQTFAAISEPSKDVFSHIRASYVQSGYVY